MPPTQREQLDAICDHLSSRRDAILREWRKDAQADPAQKTARALTRGQFNDHIPEVLDAFEQKMRARPGGAADRTADRDKKREEVKHGLHRWQQGYRLQELMGEWGHLQLCLFEELDAFARAHPEFDRESFVEANRQLISLVNEAISESAAQYQRMQQAEAAGLVHSLRVALASVNELERRRSTQIHQAVHDIGSNVFGVRVAAKRLGDTNLDGDQRVEFATLLKQGVEGVTAMLGELMELARLEAGQERREISAFDATELVTGLCEIDRPIAHERGLFLELEGPPELIVAGDSAKVRRLMQNLLVNALKYTRDGGVRVSWGEEKENWWLMVKDTGPGLAGGPIAPMAVGLQEATASARESDEKTAAREGDTSNVLAPSEEDGGGSPNQSKHGEGIGLSIVKRLCELLDASLEMVSSSESGTTFRVVLPRSYEM